MTKIKTIDDFNKLTSMITSFSHAYLFNVNRLDLSFPYIKEFAKLIICGNDYQNNDEVKDILYQIDNEEYDDLYIVNPNTIGINTEEINKLMNYMETKSLRENGKRVYIIYGFERLSREVSNKILKFLEEPNDNIYALIMTESIDNILPTIISRCQVINLSIECASNLLEKNEMMKNFFNELYDKKNKFIAYENNLFNDIISERITFYECFDALEELISQNISKKCGQDVSSEYYLEVMDNIPLNNLLKILDITNKLKGLIKKNINLNLLLDRYIIEVVKELMVCQK